MYESRKGSPPRAEALSLLQTVTIAWVHAGGSRGPNQDFPSPPPLRRPTWESTPMAEPDNPKKEHIEALDVEKKGPKRRKKEKNNGALAPRGANSGNCFAP